LVGLGHDIARYCFFTPDKFIADQSPEMSQDEPIEWLENLWDLWVSI
jgi:hypothetical protein